MGGRVLVVMGVSGSGKSTLGRALAELTGWPFLDADDMHSTESVARMAAGIPLTDADRGPWLDRVAEWIAARRAAGEPGVVACSALKRTYRDRLRQADPELRLVYLHSEREQIAQRLRQRKGHFFPPVLVWAQFGDLEEPGPDEAPITVPMGPAPNDMASSVLAALAGQSA